MNIFDGMEQLKREQPKITEALELFGISYKVYQEALEAMQPKRVYLSSYTTAITPLTYTSNSTKEMR